LRRRGGTGAHPRRGAARPAGHPDRLLSVRRGGRRARRDVVVTAPRRWAGGAGYVPLAAEPAGNEPVARQRRRDPAGARRTGAVKGRERGWGGRARNGLWWRRRSAASQGRLLGGGGHVADADRVRALAGDGGRHLAARRAGWSSIGLVGDGLK